MSHTFRPAHEAERFNAKAYRIARCLRVMPTARILELVPFLFAARDACRNSEGPRVADMMTGTGYLASHLVDLPVHLTLADVSVGMLDACNGALRQLATVVQTVGRFEETALEKNGPYDLITSLAGLHHVFAFSDSEGVDPIRSAAIQTQVVQHWSTLLKDGGRILFADVPDDRIMAEITPSPSVQRRSEHRARLTNAAADIGRDVAARLRQTAPVTSSQAEMWEDVTKWLDGVLLDDGLHIRSPASFFDSYVAAHSTIGHDACFLQQLLIDGLRELGLHCQVKLVRVPWLFPSAHDAAWYFHEKFAIGLGRTLPESLTAAEREDVLGALNEFLGTRDVCEGVFAVNWCLAYVEVRKA